MYFWWCVLIIKSTEQNPEGECFQKSFGKEGNTLQKERQPCSFGNRLLWQKGAHRKGQCCDSKGMQKSEFLPRQKDWSTEHQEGMAARLPVSCTKSFMPILPGGQTAYLSH